MFALLPMRSSTSGSRHHSSVRPKANPVAGGSADLPVERANGLDGGASPSEAVSRRGSASDRWRFEVIVRRLSRRLGGVILLAVACNPVLTWPPPRSLRSAAGDIDDDRRGLSLRHGMEVVGPVPEGYA